MVLVILFNIGIIDKFNNNWWELTLTMSTSAGYRVTVRLYLNTRSTPQARSSISGTIDYLNAPSLSTHLKWAVLLCYGTTFSRIFGGIIIKYWWAHSTSSKTSRRTSIPYSTNECLRIYHVSKTCALKIVCNSTMPDWRGFNCYGKSMDISK